MDFTLSTYQRLLKTLQSQGYAFQPLGDFIKNPWEKVVVLRHDVDKLPQNAFIMAEIEQALSISSSYYFRVVKGVFDESIIQSISDLGHEIGYHYETLDSINGSLFSLQREKLSFDEKLHAAYELFCRELEHFRRLVPISTICMHGSPWSRYSNSLIWDKYDYKKLGIIAEPYFDLDYSRILYLTDTGRRWDGDKVNVRDKVAVREVKETKDVGGDAVMTELGLSGLNTNQAYRSTRDIIQAAESGNLPDQVIINTHPHRWFNLGVGWVKELVFQNAKNLVKAGLIKIRQ